MKKVQKIKPELAWRKRNKASSGSEVDRIIDQALSRLEEKKTVPIQTS